MEQKEQIVKVNGMNSGFAIKRNGIVEIKVECDGSELASILGILQLAGKSIRVAAKVKEEKVSLGTFFFYGLHIDRDGDARLVLQSDAENANLGAMETLYQEQELVRFMFACAEKHSK